MGLKVKFYSKDLTSKIFEFDKLLGMELITDKTIIHGFKLE